MIFQPFNSFAFAGYYVRKFIFNKPTISFWVLNAVSTPGCFLHLGTLLLQFSRCSFLRSLMISLDLRHVTLCVTSVTSLYTRRIQYTLTHNIDYALSRSFYSVSVFLAKSFQFQRCFCATHFPSSFRFNTTHNAISHSMSQRRIKY